MPTTPTLITAQQTLFDADDLAGLSGRPTVQPIMPCSPREVFATEADFEHHLKHDPEALAVIGEALGIHSGLVSTQVRVNPNAGQRADLVLTPSGQGARPSIAELQLDPLDAEHVYRALLYGVLMHARDVAFIAPRMLPSANTVFNELSNRLATYRIPLRMHFLSLHTSLSLKHDTATYELRLETPPRPHPRVTLKALQAIAAFCIELGDPTLIGARFDNARRIDIYRDIQHGICIRLTARRTSTSLSIMRTPGHIQRRLRRRRLPERLAIALRKHGMHGWTHGVPHTEVLAAYHFPGVLTNELTTDANAARKVAEALIELHTSLRTTLGDPKRAHRARTIVRYAKRTETKTRPTPPSGQPHKLGPLTTAKSDARTVRAEPPNRDESPRPSSVFRGSKRAA